MSVYLFVAKFFSDASLDIQDSVLYTTPGFIRGIESGILSPICSVFSFVSGFFYARINKSYFDTDIGASVLDYVLEFGLFGNPAYHGGFKYDVGFLSGLFVGIRVIFEASVERSKNNQSPF